LHSFKSCKKVLFKIEEGVKQKEGMGMLLILLDVPTNAATPANACQRLSGADATHINQHLARHFCTARNA
jgi:hypothetical protein